MCIDCGKPISKQAKRCMRCAVTNRSKKYAPYWLGKHRSEETKQKLRESNLGKPSTRKGVSLPDKTKKKISQTLLSNPNRKKYFLNECAFDTITDDSAYWLGFLMADGSIYGRGGRAQYLCVELQKRDISHLEELTTFLGSSHPIRHCNNHNSVVLCIGSVRLVNSLMRYNIVPRKTYCATAPPILESNRHFWRGVIDGDGNIGFSTTSGKYTYPHIGICGHPQSNLIDQFAKFMKCRIPIKAKVYKSVRRNMFCISGAIAVPAIRLLYIDAPIALDRKKEIARSIIEKDWNGCGISKMSQLPMERPRRMGQTRTTDTNRPSGEDGCK